MVRTRQSSKKRGEAFTSTVRPPRTKRTAHRQTVIEASSKHVEEEQREEEEEEVQYDRSRFTSFANEAWYRSRLTAKVLAEKDVAPDAEAVYHLKEAFAKLRWENFFNLPEVYYEDLVREFYANVEDKKLYDPNLDEIKSIVRGIEIHVHRASGTNEARINDIYFVGKMETRLGNLTGIPLGSIITHHMWAVVRSSDVKHAFPYARFLTLKFQRAGVDFSNVRPKLLGKYHIFTLPICKQFLENKSNKRAMVIYEGPSGAEAEEEEEEFRRQEAGHDMGASTSRCASRRGASSSHPSPPSPHDTRSMLKKIMDKLLCIEAQVKKNARDNRRNTERLRRIEVNMGIDAPPTSSSSPDEQDDGGAETIA